MSDTTIGDFLDGLENRVADGIDWTPGVVFRGDADKAGTAMHEGDVIPVEQFQARRERHAEQSGIDGVAQINLNVVKTDAEPFENEVRTDGRHPG